MSRSLALLLILPFTTPVGAANYGSQDSCDAYAHPAAGLSGEDTVYSGENMGNKGFNLLVTSTQIIGYEWSCERIVPNATGPVDLLCSGSGLDFEPQTAVIALEEPTLTFVWRNRRFVLHRCETSQLISRPGSSGPKATGPCH